MVAKGYSQIARVDYFKIFSIVVKPTTIQIVLTLAMSKKWPIKQLDVHNVFLHGELREDVFIVQLLTLLTNANLNEHALRPNKQYWNNWVKVC